MEYNVKTSTPEKVKTACIVVPVFESNKLSPAAIALNSATGNSLSKILRKGDIQGKVGQTLLIHNLSGIGADRVLLVGCGKEPDVSEQDYRKICTASITAQRTFGASESICLLHTLNVDGRDLPWKIIQAVRIFQASKDRKDQLKSNHDDTEISLKKITWLTASKDEQAAVNKGIKIGSAIANGVTLCKELGDLPGNICTPTYLAEHAKSMQNQLKKFKTTVLEEKHMAELGMGALLSVSRGSCQPAKFIIMEYNGGKRGAKPIVLVGKGLTFDSGGISIKPSPAMDEMKYDMCGGASVFGTLQAIAEMELPINVVGVVPSSENMPDGDANKPGDIVTSLSGQTIEVLNTDAEGRLILCDALTYSEKFNPELVIDIATLTGACIVALGHVAAGLLSNTQTLAHDLLLAGEESGDRCWQLPLWDEYQDSLKSNFADMANIGSRSAGTITAACFLSRYTKNYPWAHLDVAGTAWNSGGGNEKGSTGRPVPLLVQFLLSKV